MNLNYKNLYKKGENNDLVRSTFYREKTNILAYYIITFILLDNYNNFIEWCSNNNLSLLQFKKTIANQMSFCHFISQKYRTKKILHDIECVEKMYKNTKVKNKNNNKNNLLMNNLRMTICELG
jgi:hypothetical protein